MAVGGSIREIHFILTYCIYFCISMDAKVRVLGILVSPVERLVWMEGTTLDGWRGPILTFTGDMLETRVATGEDSAMFRQFAALPFTQGAVLDFATKYGPLGSWLKGATAKIEVNGTTQDVVGDPWYEWVCAVTELKHWLTLSELADDGDSKGIAKLVSSLPADNGGDLFTERGTLNFLRGESLPLLDYTGKDRIRMAQSIVCKAVSVALAGASRFVAADLGTGWRLQVLQSPTGERRLSVGGIGLRSLVWLQFAASISENKKFRNCEVCGKPFELSPDLNRTSRFYCKGNRCRLKAFRERKREARTMKENGHTLKEIADKLGSEVGTIRGWLKAKS